MTKIDEMQRLVNGIVVNITEKDGQAVVSSREVAQNFEKEHSKVLRVIKEKIEVNPILASPKYFIETTYLDKSNRQSKEYLMTRDGFSFLVMGFTGAKADIWKLKYIEAFNKMETLIKE
ncbi:Rha family transcriptional regulator, partial [Intestinibacter sp.]|uniref:Rha family transcriptional regulator n=1 Tax=Intestinibacter sp. TaxID=1965304 RepID=UPI002A75D857